MKKSFLAFTLAFAIALAGLTPANATILFVGGEDSDFINLNGASASTTAGTFSSSYERESMAVGAGAGCGNVSPPNYYFMTPSFTANSVVWIHANSYSSASGCGGVPTSDVIRAYSPDGYPRILVQQGGSAFGQYNIYSRNQAGTNTLLVSMTTPCFIASRISFLDLYINYSTSGEVTLYCNGQQVADYSGDITTNGATQLNQVQFSNPSVNFQTSYWSEIIVSTANTRSMRLVALKPTANGNTTNWGTGGVSNINETTLDTTTVNASGTAGQIQEYTVGSLPSGTFSVSDVIVAGQAQVDTTGPQHLQAMVRTGGTDYTSSNLSPPQSAWGYIWNDWTTNPNTGVAWTTSDLGAAGFNIGFESQN